MDILVSGNQVLSGTIHPSGSKNATLALIPATLLFDRPVTLNNVPEIADVDRLVKILTKLGSKIFWDKNKKRVSLDNKHLTLKNLTASDVGSMRATSLLWGPLLGRFGKIDFSQLPGGCTLGTRTVEPHYQAFQSLGTKITQNRKGVKMDASRAKAGEVWLTEMSPTATENVLFLASTLKGTTKIFGAASEPQVQDVCHFLNSTGAKIKGIGSNVLEITGVKSFKSLDFTIPSDHYEVGTFLAFGAVTGGKVSVTDVEPLYLKPIEQEFKRLSINLSYRNHTATINRQKSFAIPKGIDGQTHIIRAQPWPALPVDMLPIFIPLALSAKKGSVLFHNWMYEAGLFWTSELLKLGANIVMCDPHRVIATSGNKLHGATLEAPYIIRAVVSMVMAAMTAKGKSKILNADALYRGHPHFAENLRLLGAKIEENPQQ